MGEIPDRVGKYHLLAKLGHGGMADVYLAMSTGPADFTKLVVLKTLRAGLADDPAFVAMLMDEARIAARISHPNVVQTNEVGGSDGTYFIAMEYLSGQALRQIDLQVRRQNDVVPEKIHLAILSQVLAGLHAAHELRDYDGTPFNIVHRDATPHNIFVTYQGVVKLVDFGIAKAARRTADTETGIMKGKVPYMAPEQVMALTIDRRADVFSVGVMLWEAVTGRRLWEGLETQAVLSRLLTGDLPQSAKEACPTVSDGLDAICRRALAVDPDDRFSTAREFQKALEKHVHETNQHVGAEELGAWLATLFAQERAEFDRKLQKLLAEEARRRLSGADASTRGTSLSDTWPNTFGKPPASSEEASETATAHVTMTRVAPRRFTRHAWGLATVAFVAVGGLVAYRYVGRSDPQPTAPTPSVAAAPVPPEVTGRAPAPTTSVSIPTVVSPVDASVPSAQVALEPKARLGPAALPPVRAPSASQARTEGPAVTPAPPPSGIAHTKRQINPDNPYGTH